MGLRVITDRGLVDVDSAPIELLCVAADTLGVDCAERTEAGIRRALYDYTHARENERREERARNQAIIEETQRAVEQTKARNRQNPWFRFFDWLTGGT